MHYYYFLLDFASHQHSSKTRIETMSLFADISEGLLPHISIPAKQGLKHV